MPPNFIEILATESGDYGATKFRGMRTDPNNPENIIIESLRQVTALEETGWQGFSSDQL
jgi:hypothetical protein